MSNILSRRLSLLYVSLFLLFVAAAGFVAASVSSAKGFKSSVAEPSADSVRILNIATNDIIFNSTDEKIYASVPSSAGLSGNSIQTIDPRTGVTDLPVFVGSEPSKLVLTPDQQKLYVHLAGSFSIGTFDVATRTLTSRFPLGQDNFSGLYTARDFAVAPDDPTAIAVARYYLGLSPPQGGVAVFKNGVRLSQTGPGHSVGSHFLAFGATGTTLYGSNDYGIKTMSVNSNGVTMPSNNGTTTVGAYSSFRLANGTIYTSAGQAINAAAGTLVGTFPNAFTSSHLYGFVPDPSVGRVYYLVRNSTSAVWEIRAYDISTFTQIGSLPLPNVSGDAGSLVRWGTNGLAFRTTGNQLVLVQTSLIPTSNPLPEPPPLPTVTPTPTPTPIATFVRRIDIPTNDVVYNQQTNSLLVSVPGIAGFGVGNSVTHIDPENGVVGPSVFIGSEPNKLAASDDGQTLYATLDGANSIRRYNIVTRTPGIQFATNNIFWQPHDIAVMPGYPGTIAVTARYDGVGLFDDGVQRPSVVDGGAYAINSIAFSNISNIFYGYDNESSGFELVKFRAWGPETFATMVGRNLISGYSVKIKYSGGLIYSTLGRVLDPETAIVSGTYQGAGGTMAIDPTLRRVFFLNDGTLTAFDMDTFIKVGSASVGSLNGTPTSLTRWGANGLAFRTSGSSTLNPLYIIQSNLVSNSGSVPAGVQLGSGTQTGFEGSQPVTVTVTRNGDLSTASTVNYATIDETATAGSDYTPQNGMLTFGPGESTKTISVPILNDTVFENNEVFSVALSNPSAGTFISGTATTSISIFSDDSRPSSSAVSASVVEPRINNTGVANVSVRLSNPSVETITLNYSTANSSALAGSDYVARSGALTFQPMETTKTVSIDILADRLAESNETFTLNLISAVNAGIQTSTATVTIQNTTTKIPFFDYDGNQRSELSVFRPGEGRWYMRGSAGYTFMTWGVATDIPVPADYDNDGKTDLAIFRPSEGRWYLFKSGSQSFDVINWGQNGDIPMPADHDADFRADLVIFRPSNNTWYRYLTNDNSFSVVEFGAVGDKPVAGDFDGDGRSDIAIFRPSDGNWHILKSAVGYFVQTWGEVGDHPVPADYDGDGATDLAVFRPSAGGWYVANNSNGSVLQSTWGVAGDEPVAADYDGDGKSDVAVFRPSNATWYVIQSTAGILIQQFGQTGDVPTQSSYLY